MKFVPPHPPNKTCAKCKIEKSIRDFYRLRKGLHPDCMDCCRLKQRELSMKPEIKNRRQDYQKNRLLNEPEFRQKSVDRSLNFYESVFGRAATLVAGAYRRAAKRGQTCTLTIDYIVKLIEIGKCPVTGFTFSLKSLTNKYKNPYAPSLDRIDATKPYSDENARVVIWQYNLMKGQLSDQEVLEICKAVIANAYE